ncbi:MAG: SET domain-containing protein-lysine N-methyltransferase [Ilumatobacteraceae bacterium]|nr:SET domain-containing protein-lysine N-methyltransferase [Ilumatobacteraceae bacterium]
MAYLCHLLTPRAAARLLDGNELGIFAISPVSVGTVIAVCGSKIYSSDVREHMPQELMQDALQIEDNLFVQPMDNPEHTCSINHSCHPNSGFLNAVQIIAMQDIPAGQEITYDDAMTNGTSRRRFVCHCNSIDCRGEISGDDWRQKILQERYQGYFSPYLARRITASRLARKLKKNDVEQLLLGYDNNPISSITDALQIVLGKTFCQWPSLIAALPIDADRQRLLLTKDSQYLDQLVRELNELRGENFLPR